MISDDLKALVEKVSVARALERESLVAAYLKETGLRPSQVMLVEQMTPTGYRVWLEPREPWDPRISRR